MGNHDDVVPRREIGHGEFALPPFLDKRSLLTHLFFLLALECHPTIHKEPACQSDCRPQIADGYSGGSIRSACFIALVFFCKYPFEPLMLKSSCPVQWGRV